jgi:putative MATE family efflux protein
MNSYGNSKTPFWISSIGLISNIILDPIFIFYFGMGVRGAAIATFISNFVVVALFFSFLFRKYKYFVDGFKPRLDILKKLIKLGIPVSIQRTLFTSIAIVLGKIVASFGAEGISAQRIGLQIESISYMTAGGFQGALSAFVGQNYGAGIYERIRRGYFKGVGIIVFLALFISFIFYFEADSLVAIFIDKNEVVEIGASYLKIIAFSQIFMVMEITTVGAFNGIGKTLVPSINSIVFTGMRIPMALFLVGIYGINGIWLSITISSIIKGSSLLTFFCINLKKLKKQLT